MIRCLTSYLYADLPGYISPSVLTGDELRPDLLITLENKCIYILELTVGFEFNLLANATRKRQKNLSNFASLYFELRPLKLH
jgi:hypothetical protein